MRAARLVIPIAQQLLCQEGATWGPDWGSLIIKFEQLEVAASVNNPREWDPEWGQNPGDFIWIARSKAEATHRTGLSTRELIHLEPHLFENGEYAYVGSAHRHQITAAFSGGKSETDEAIANIAIDVVMYFVYMDKRDRDEREEAQI